ncbi:MAG: hypothetical protein P8170_10110 [Gemmatimonadota bacterium]|jgi:hypothetical protein
MSPRKTILKELARIHANGGAAVFTRPASIPGFGDRPAEYQKAVNKLLQERLIQGQKDDDGRMAIGVNEHRITEVQRAIRPVWQRPALWLATVVLLLATAGLVA